MPRPCLCRFERGGVLVGEPCLYHEKLEETAARVEELVAALREIADAPSWEDVRSYALTLVLEDTPKGDEAK